MTSKGTYQRDPMMEDVVKYGMVVLAIYALPAMLLAALLFQGIRRTRHQVLAWGSALVVGVVGIFCVYAFGHPQVVALAYTYAIIHQIRSLTGQWDWLVPWNVARPMWLESLPLAPFVGFVLSMSSTKSVEQQLRGQVKAKARQVEQAAERARKRTSGRTRIPEVLHEKIVLGIPIYDPEER